jgi:hypothetical protein
MQRTPGRIVALDGVAEAQRRLMASALKTRLCLAYRSLLY